VKRHNKVNALLVVPVRFWLCSKAQRQFYMMICFSAITAVRRDLKTAKFFGTPNGPPLQRRADALATPLLPYRKGVYLRLSEWDAIQNQWRAVGFRADGLDTETQEAYYPLILQGHAEVAGQMAGILTQDERRLLRSSLL
jgi:hypothetical protein